MLLQIIIAIALGFVAGSKLGALMQRKRDAASINRSNALLMQSKEQLSTSCAEMSRAVELMKQMRATIEKQRQTIELSRMALSAALVGDYRTHVSKGRNVLSNDRASNLT